MIRAQNHSSYPRVGDSPLDQQLRAALRAHERGRADEAAVVEARDETTTIVVAEQARAFIDVVTDGQVAWEGPIAHLARHLDGLEPGGLRRWFHTNFLDRRATVTGEIVHRAPFLVHDWRVAAGVSVNKPVKVVLPGPVSVARLVDDRHYGDPDRLADAIAAALAAEVAALAAEGARWFQRDEPLLCRHPDDAGRVARTASSVFDAAGEGAETVLSTFFGGLDALDDAALAALPGAYLGLDVVHGGVDRAGALLRRLPAGRGVALGLFDATTTRQEDAADVAAALEPLRETLVGREVLVGPNAGLELLPRDHAFDKLLHARYLVEKLAEDWTWD